jgi:hypothetical protein
MEKRLKETITILKKLTVDLGLPYEDEEVKAIKDRMSEFVKTGEPWSGTLPLTAWDREAVLEMRASGKIELTLKALSSLKANRKRLK